MREQHVSAAAERLHLTQPAISNSLQQLRELFQDELLIRGPKKMVPTQKALLLAPKIEQAMRQLETSLLVGTFSRHLVLLAEKQYPLKHVDPPFDIPPLYIAQIWDRQQDNDSGLIWLRKLIKSVCEEHFF